MARESVREVVASSSGNHGSAVALAASLLQVPATIYLPRNPNPIKRRRIAELGARIVEVGAIDLTGAAEAAAAHAAEHGAFFLNDATDPDLPAGPATIALEILEQAPDTGAIFVPIGDSALIRGVAAAARSVRPGIRIIGVQAERAPCYYLSWKQGRAVSTDSCDTIADGLATRVPQAPSVAALATVVNEIVLVSEDQLLAAVKHLLIEEHIVAEPSGAAATAAALAAGTLSEPTVLLVTGGNLAPELLPRVAAIRDRRAMNERGLRFVRSAWRRRAQCRLQSPRHGNGNGELMRPHRLILAAGLLAGSILPARLAVAQGEPGGPAVRDHPNPNRRPVGPVAIRSVQPKNGAPGTTVTIRGTFPPGARLLFGGREIPVTRADRRSIVFTVPEVRGGPHRSWCARAAPM